MKQSLLLLLSVVWIGGCQAQRFLEGLSPALSEGEVVAGLKEALRVGSANASDALSAPDAYYADSLLRIPFPPEAHRVESALREIGQGALVDTAVKALNAAAELAAAKAAPIFVSAIEQITIRESFRILKGRDDEATRYLREKTSPALRAAFRPVILEALDGTQATRYWDDVMTVYNQIPLVDKIDPDLTGFVTGKALEGLFIQLGREEARIRTDPAARVTELLRRVFGRPSTSL